jgi:hypothetical protein
MVEPEEFDEKFKKGIEQAEGCGVLEQYRAPGRGVLTAVEYSFSRLKKSIANTVCV